jgi:hypothetical protein
MQTKAMPRRNEVMKTGLTLVELATEIERRANAKKDYVVSTKNLRMEAATTEAHEAAGITGTALVLAERETVGINNVAHRQIGEYADIPAKYYDRMRAEAPALLAMNVNNWMRETSAKRIVRTLDNTGRAFLSDRFRPLENEEVAQAVLPPLLDMGVEVMSADITEQRLYIKVVDKRIRREMPAGRKFFRTQSPGLVITNSEVGYGGLSINASVLDHACTTLAVFSRYSMKKHHAGSYLVGDLGDCPSSDDLRHLSVFGSEALAHLV